MTMYYSARAKGFFDSRIHSLVPDDAIEVTNEAYHTLMGAQANGSTIQADANGRPVAVAPAPPTLDESKASLCRQIDRAADDAYAAIGGSSPGRLAEYQQAKADATAYKASGYAGMVPSTIDCWAQAQGWTAQQACADILATAAAWEGALAAIRSARLLGKGAVTAAADAIDAQSAADAAIADIRAVPAGL